jgi:glycosyltransferase involved in cell wall biosynthesis
MLAAFSKPSVLGMSQSTRFKKLPVSLICPVRNSMSGLPHHAAHLRSLAAVAEELIVVDSQSHDGTIEYLKKALEGCKARFLDHPPGLYQSWNYAISEACQPYVTVATVGDTLPATSLGRLVETIRRFDADVVVSPPTVLGDDRQELSKKFAIHDLVDSSGITDAAEVPGPVWLLYFLFYMPSSLLCSSASNLYRTSLLQAHPFPADFGHAGDSAWSLQMSLNTRWVVDPQVESSFWVHPPSPHKVTLNIAVIEKLRTMARGMLNEARPNLLEIVDSEKLLEYADESIDTLCEAALLMQQYRQKRISMIPRFFQPKAARLLALKNQANARRKLRLQLLKDETRRMGLLTFTCS